MNTDIKKEPQNETGETITSNTPKPRNPFKDGLLAEEDIALSKEEIENEEQFKEAQTERD